MNIVIVSVLLSIAVVVLVPIGFVFGGLWGWGVLLAVFILLLILSGLYGAEERLVKAAILREQITAGKAARARASADRGRSASWSAGNRVTAA